MLIPKLKKTAKITNPFRPNIGVTREHSVCRISWKDYHIEYDVVVERLAVDADHNEEFIAVMEATVPESDRYRCQDHEMWLIDSKWKKFIIDTAKEYFDNVVVNLRKW